MREGRENRRGRRGIINNLRELRLRAGLTQAELGKRSGVSTVTVGYIEQGRVKPTELTRRRLLKGISASPLESGQPRPQSGQDPVPAPLRDIMGRDEFFLRLRPKLSRALAVFFSEFLIATFLKNAEFFSRQRYYPGDFATAVELLGELLRAQRRLFVPEMVKDDDDGAGFKRGSRVMPRGYNKKCQKKR